MRCVLAVAALLAICILAGCGKKPLTRKETRAITAEVIDAAQKITAHKSEIAIRPELQPNSSRSASGSAKANGSGALVADSIFVTLSDSSQLAALRQSLGDIAHHHKLQLSENSSAGVMRFDLAFDGNRTQTIHVVTPLAARERSSPSQSRGGASPRLAIILDDLGYERSAADELLALPFPLTVSVLPHLPLSSEVAEEAFRRGDQVLLHLPMESEADGAKPEEIELRVGMNSQQVESALEGMLETVPHAIGVNNHQGSRATSDPALMAELMPALRQRGLFFIDSRTAASTVAYDAAERAGVRAASRKVFLDDTATREAVLAQLDLAARDAARDGFAIAIGHPRPATIAALTEGVPRVEARGVRLVFVSDVVH